MAKKCHVRGKLPTSDLVLGLKLCDKNDTDDDLLNRGLPTGQIVKWKHLFELVSSHENEFQGFWSRQYYCLFFFSFPQTGRFPTVPPRLALSLLLTR